MFTFIGGLVGIGTMLVVISLSEKVERAYRINKNKQ